MYQFNPSFMGLPTPPGHHDEQHSPSSANVPVNVDSKSSEFYLNGKSQPLPPSGMFTHAVKAEPIDLQYPPPYQSSNSENIHMHTPPSQSNSMSAPHYVRRDSQAVPDSWTMNMTPRESLALLLEASVAAAAAEKKAERKKSKKAERKKPKPGAEFHSQLSQQLSQQAATPSSTASTSAHSSCSSATSPTTSSSSNDSIISVASMNSASSIYTSPSSSSCAATISDDRKPQNFDFHSKRTLEIDRYISAAIHKVQAKPQTERKDELKPIDRRMLLLPPGWSRFNDIHRDLALLDECKKLIRGTQGCGRDCEAKFKNLVEFSKHIDMAHDRSFRPFLCPKEQCPWSVVGFHERSECTRHIRTKHYNPMYTCDFPGCHKIYNRSDAFRRHVRQSHGNHSTVFNVVTVEPQFEHYDPDTDDEL